MKKLNLLLLTAGISILTCFSAFAGEWRQDSSGWRYDNGGTYQAGGWNWIDGRCYYFTPEGYCLIDTVTPDGYHVDASGAWVVNGVVQTQGVAQAGISNALQFVAPAGYEFYTQVNNVTLYANYNDYIILGVYDWPLGFSLPKLSENQRAELDRLTDEYITSEFGTYAARSNRQLSSGVWSRYDMTSDNFLQTTEPMVIYVRYNSGNVHLILFTGNLSGLDTDAIMNASVK